MDLSDGGGGGGGGVRLLTELCGRVEDVQTVVQSLRLTDVRISVSAHCPRHHAAADGGDAPVVRPRILPAFKPTSPLRHSRRSTPSSAGSGIATDQSEILSSDPVVH